jgi:hypothetical protein
VSVRRVFDRLVSFDEQSRNYPIRSLIGDQKLRSYTWSVNKWLDQKAEGACVGFGWAHELAARPHILNVTTADARSFYFRAQQLDEWEGENYDGTSVLAGVKAVMDLRPDVYTEYRWAFGEHDLALAVGYKGPAVIGVNWYDGMTDPQVETIKGVRQAWIRREGELYGGHCVLVNGFSTTKNAYHIHNSWGIGWGWSGGAWISREDMAQLLSEDGEACIPLRANR